MAIYNRLGDPGMARCSYCGRETELYTSGTPECIRCAERLRTPKQSIHARLLGALAEATVEHLAAKAAYRQVMRDIPDGTPNPDGVQRIRSISQELSIAEKRLASAHSRLADFLDTGAIPEDLLQDH